MEPAVAARDLVYVATNDPRPNRNAVLAYRRAEDGTLSQLGAYLTGGTGFANPAGIVGPEDSDQNVIINEERTMLFAVNGGSDSIAVFGIAGDGSLSLVPGAPFASSGTQPVSLGLRGTHLYVVHKDQDPTRRGPTTGPGYAVFEVGDGGALSARPEMTISAERGSSPAQALVSPDGRLLFGAEPFAGTLRSFRIEPGRLDPQPATPVGAAHPSPVGLAVHPRERILYVGLPTRAEVAVYEYDEQGRLTLVRTVPNSGRAVCWLITNRDGSRMYTVSNASNSVSVYDTSDPLHPLEVQSVTLGGVGGAFQESLDPAGRFLHVVTVNGAGNRPQDNALHVLAVNPDDGRLGAPRATPLPVPPEAHPAGVACA